MCSPGAAPERGAEQRVPALPSPALGAAGARPAAAWAPCAAPCLHKNQRGTPSPGGDGAATWGGPTSQEPSMVWDGGAGRTPFFPTQGRTGPRCWGRPPPHPHVPLRWTGGSSGAAPLPIAAAPWGPTEALPPSSCTTPIYYFKSSLQTSPLTPARPTGLPPRAPAAEATKPLGAGDTGVWGLRVSKTKREGRNSRQKKTPTNQTQPPPCHRVPGDAPGTRDGGSLSQRGDTGLCGVPRPAAGVWEAQDQSRGRRGRQSWEYREFSISGGSLAWNEGMPTPKSAGRRRAVSTTAEPLAPQLPGTLLGGSYPAWGHREDTQTPPGHCCA